MNHSADDSSAQASEPSSLWQSLRAWLGLGKPEASLKEALGEVIEEHEEHSSERLAPEEKVMLHNVLSFGDIQVHDIMIPRTDIEAVPLHFSLRCWPVGHDWPPYWQRSHILQRTSFGHRKIFFDVPIAGY